MPRPALPLLLITLGLAVVPAAAAEARPSAASAAKLIRQCANHYRRAAGLPDLTPDATLDRAARDFASQMRNERFFAHESPDGESPQDRVDALAPGVWSVGENIAAGYASARKTCSGWMASSGHRANILDPDYTSIGVGVAYGGSYRTYWVQDFGTRADSSDSGDDDSEG